MSSAQEKIDGVIDAERGKRKDLLARLENPSVLTMLRRVAIGHDPQGLARVAYSAAVKNDQLLKCSPDSIVAGVIEAAQLGLSVDGVLGHAYLVPYWNGKTRSLAAQMQLGYRGFMALAYRSDRVLSITASEICERDAFEYEEGSTPRLRHQKPLAGDRGAMIGAYAIAHLKGGGTVMRVLRMDELDKRRARSSAWKAFEDGKIKDTPWNTDPEAMYRKTAIRDLGKWLPVEQLQRAAVREEQRDIGVLDAPAKPDEVVIDALPEGSASLDALIEEEERLTAGPVTAGSKQRLQEVQAQIARLEAQQQKG